MADCLKRFNKGDIANSLNKRTPSDLILSTLRWYEFTVPPPARERSASGIRATERDVMIPSASRLFFRLIFETSF